MIETRGLVKAFGSRLVLRGITLHISAGEFVTLVGPNGAGKTTLMRILATLSRPSAGQVLVGGCDLTRDPMRARHMIGLVSHRTLLYDDLSAAENLQLYAELYNLPREIGKRAVQARIRDALARVGLAKRADDRVRTFSRGMQQRLALARATLHDPAVLLLDEPYTGLDAQGSALLDALIAEWHAQGRTIIAALHDLARAAALCQRALILANGKLAADLSISDAETLIVAFNALTPS